MKEVYHAARTELPSTEIAMLKKLALAYAEQALQGDLVVRTGDKSSSFMNSRSSKD